MIPKIAIIGRPNVGKSSLFNRIVGSRKAIIHDVAGTTRDVIAETVKKDGQVFEISDTAGYLLEKGSEISQTALLKVKETINAADALVLVVDGNVSPTANDIKIADLARKSGKRVLVAVNKLDNGKGGFLADYEKMGFAGYFPMSVIHNIGVADFIQKLPKTREEAEIAEIEKNEFVISICGRPNVGKSSLLNAMLKKDRAIVSSVPGTTRDVVSESTELGGVRFKLSDTAGARKPGKIGKAYKKGEPVEKYSFLRTQAEIERSDIVMVVIDGSDKIAAQDLHIAGNAKELGKGIILVINKWDLVKETEQNTYLAHLRKQFNFMIWVPAIFVSAKTGRNVEEIIGIIKKVRENQTRQVDQASLTRILEDFVLVNKPKGLGTFRPKMFNITETDVVPPTFTITAKFHAFVHFAWRRALENELRRHFDFTGTPIKIDFRGNE